MSPHRGTGHYESASRVPLDVCDAVVLLGVHEHDICGDFLVVDDPVAFVVHVVKVEVAVLLDTDCAD